MNAAAGELSLALKVGEDVGQIDVPLVERHRGGGSRLLCVHAGAPNGEGYETPALATGLAPKTPAKTNTKSSCHLLRDAIRENNLLVSCWLLAPAFMQAPNSLPRDRYAHYPCAERAAPRVPPHQTSHSTQAGAARLRVREVARQPQIFLLGSTSSQVSIPIRTIRLPK